MHGTRDSRNTFEVPEHAPVAVNVRFEDFPIIDSRFSRHAGISQHETRLNFFRQNRHGLAMNAVRIEPDSADSSVQRGVVVLAASGYFDNLCGGTRDPCARRRFGVSFYQRALFGRKKLQQPSRDGKAEFLGGTKLVQALEMLFLFGIERTQIDTSTSEGSDAAGSENVDCEIQRQRTGM